MAAGRSPTYDDVTVRTARHEDYDDVMRIDRNVHDVSVCAHIVYDFGNTLCLILTGMLMYAMRGQ